MNKPQTNAFVKVEPQENQMSLKRLSLEEVVDIRSGFSFRSALEEVEEGVPVVQIRDLTDSGRVNQDSVICVSDEGFKPKHYVKAGEILFAARGSQRTAALVDEDTEEMVAGSQFLVLTPKHQNELLPAYLTWLLSTEEVRRRLDAMATSSTIPHVSISMLKKLEVCIPSVETQERLLAMVQAADREVYLLQNLVEQTKRRNTALLNTFLKTQLELDSHGNI